MSTVAGEAVELRAIEVQRANLAELDLEAGELLLRGKSRDRRVHLRAHVLALLRAWLVLRLTPPDQPLFVGFASTCRGLRLSRRGIRGVLARAFAAAGLFPAALSQPRRDALAGRSAGRRWASPGAMRRGLGRRNAEAPYAAARSYHVRAAFVSQTRSASTAVEQNPTASCSRTSVAKPFERRASAVTAA
ncbi:MAG: hypothetical protein ACLPYS_15595 [Vulcanimicrobiaceae bacterium]